MDGSCHLRADIDLIVHRTSGIDYTGTRLSRLGINGGGWLERRTRSRRQRLVSYPYLRDLMAVRPIPRPKAEKSQRIFDWSEGTTPAKLGAEEAGHDLEIMKVVVLRVVWRALD